MLSRSHNILCYENAQHNTAHHAINYDHKYNVIY
jgi:hypothetical protein